jgi:beta-lactamase superfamily II metal-dependent hydrolase
MNSWTKRSFVAVLAVVMTVPLAAGAAGTFDDDDGSVHEADIESLASERITRGCNPPANDRYCPEDPVTRAQMASFLVRALELSAASSAGFTDTSGSVHAADIDALAAAGITRGCNPPANDQYCPGDPVTRAQMASFLVRALELPAGSSGIFTDTSGSVHAADIDALAASGITRGCNPPDNDRYCPQDPVTRAQMASFLVRALRLPGGGPPPQEPPQEPQPEPGVSGTLDIRFLDVAFGESALYFGECGEVGMIDVPGGQQGQVATQLADLGIHHLDWVIVSLYDRDAVGGVNDLAEDHGITYGAVYDRGGGENAYSNMSYAAYYAWITAPDQDGLRHPVDIGDKITLCEGTEQVAFTVLSAGTDGTAAGGIQVTDENDKGLCLKIEFGDYDMASCGDLQGRPVRNQVDVESAVAPAIGNVEVVKINKHGSDDSSNPTWVNTLFAEAAILTPAAHEENPFNEYPDQDILDRWRDSGSVLYGNHNTGVSPQLADGFVRITTNGINNFRVRTGSGKDDPYSIDERG